MGMEQITQEAAPATATYTLYSQDRYPQHCVFQGNIKSSLVAHLKINGYMDENDYIPWHAITSISFNAGWES